jgi:predicted  nucleic acid-binding Zn-ribbon protein
MAKKENGPDSLVLAHLRELRAEMKSMDARMEKRFDGIEERLDGIDKRIDAQRRALQGESVLRRYAALEVEERLAVSSRKSNNSRLRAS